MINNIQGTTMHIHPHKLNSVEAKDMLKEVFGVEDGHYTGASIKDQFSPVKIEKDGWNTGVTIVEDGNKDQRLILSSIEPDGRTIQTVLNGVPVGLEMRNGFATIMIDNDEGGGFSVKASCEKTPVEHVGIYIPSASPSSLGNSFSKVYQNIDKTREGEAFKGISIGKLSM